MPLSRFSVIMLLSLSYHSLSCMHRLTSEDDCGAHTHHPAQVQRFVNLQDEGNTPLHTAAYFGEINDLKDLLASGANINQKNRRGFTALHYAAYGGHEDIVAELLAHGAAPDRKAKNGRRPLHLAAYSGHNAITWRLLGSGANPSAHDKKKKTPVHLAIANNFPDTVRLLVQRVCNPFRIMRRKFQPNDICSMDLARFFHNLRILVTKLHWAIENHKHETIGNLLAQGAPVNGRNEKGNTPLHTAVLAGSYPTLYTLLTHGANPTIQNYYGQTPIHLALEQPLIDSTNPRARTMLAFFIRAATVTETQLWRAIRANNLKETESLITQAANPLAPWEVPGRKPSQPKNPVHACDPNGNSLLHMAAIGHSHRLVITLLMNYGLNPRQPNNAGQTAIDLAQANLTFAQSPGAYICTSRICEILQSNSPNQKI